MAKKSAKDKGTKAKTGVVKAQVTRKLSMTVDAPKNLGGRPVKYTDEFLEKEAEVLEEWIKEDKHIYLGTFARQRGYSMSRFTEFCQKSPRFSVAIDYAKQWQTEKLLVGGLTKEFDGAQVRYTMARICDPMWRQSWDSEQQITQQAINIQINEVS